MRGERERGRERERERERESERERERERKREGGRSSLTDICTTCSIVYNIPIIINYSIISTMWYSPRNTKKVAIVFVNHLASCLLCLAHLFHLVYGLPAS